MNIASIVQAARSAESSGQVAKAVQLCNQALSLDSNCVDALLVLGSLAARHGQTNDAISILRKVACIDPNQYDATRWLTTLLIGRDGGLEAVDFGKCGVQLRPNDADSHVALGLAALGAGDNSLAIESFSSAVELSPKMSGAYHNLGVAYQRDDCLDEAIESFQRAIELSPQVGETYLHLGRCFMVKRMGHEAWLAAEMAAKLLPTSVSAKRLLADASYAAAIGERGQEHIARAIEKTPESGFPHALMGSRLQEQGNFAEAEQSLLRSIELQPIQGLAYYFLAHNRKLRESDRTFFEKIEPLAEKADLEREERLYANFALGKVFDDLGEYEKAIHHFDLANEEAGEVRPRKRSSDSDKYTARIRRFIELMTPEFLERFRSIGLESDEPIFIFGMPRSGTTLLEQIISRHSTVGAAGEQFFWRDNGRRILNLEGVLQTKEFQKVAHRYLEVLRSVAPGNAHVTDKFPSNYIYLGLLHLIFPNGKFIHARRNPVDICLSMYMRPFFSIQEPGQTRIKLVEGIRLYRESMDHWRRVLPLGSFLDVDYEQMVANPEAMTRTVIDYCGLEWEDACLRPEEGDRRVITFSKWQVRQPVYKTSVARWRNYEPWLGVFRELLED